MRALPILLSTAALLIATGTAQADTGSTEARRSNTEQLAQFTGSYKLSDSRRAEIFLLGTRLYVKIGRGQQKELLPTGPSRFSSIDGKMSIQFGTDVDTDRIVLEDVRSNRSTLRLAMNERVGHSSAN